MIRTSQRFRGLGLAIAACAVLCGSEDSCESPHSTPSTELATSSMAAQITARAIGNGRTHIRVDLTSGEDVDLTGGDRFVATHVDAATQTPRSKDLVEQEHFDAFAYTGAFNAQEKDDVIEIAFDRSATGGTSAPASSVTLPTPFDLDWVEDLGTMSPAPRRFSRSAATPRFVTWEPLGAPAFEPGDLLSYSVVGSCIESSFGTIDWAAGEDSLSLTGVLQDQPPPRDGQSCLLHVVFTLRRTGIVDPAFSGGSFVASQIRDMHLESTP